MGFIDDDQDKMLDLLEVIARNTGGLSDLDEVQQDVTIESSNVNNRVGSIKPRDYVVVETADMDGANDDGTVTLEPGDTVRMASFRSDSAFSVLAVGAYNQQGVEYVLRVDNDRSVGGVTQTPLGDIGAPFSFVEKAGGGVSCKKSIEYIARADADLADPVDVAARLHLEVMA